MDASRQALVEAAARRFAEAGRDGVGPGDLVKRLGLPPEAVFKHFQTRDALFAAVLGLVQGELFAHIEAQCPVIPGESGLSMVLRLAEAYCRFLEDRPRPYLEILRARAEAPEGPWAESDRELARLAARVAKQFEVLLLLGRIDASVRDEADGETARRILHVLVGTVRLGLTSRQARVHNLRGMLTALAGRLVAPVRAA